MDYAVGICPHCFDGEVQVPIEEWEPDEIDPTHLHPIFGEVYGECSNGCPLHSDDIDDLEFSDFVLWTS